jgi:hypothetical protein
MFGFHGYAEDIMSDLWWFVAHLPDEPGLDRLGQYCRFVNDDELSRAWRGPREPLPSDFPTARLKITLESFSLDCFNWVTTKSRAFTLVSQDLRDSMALAPQDVQYLPVDASLSAPLPRSKNYMIMRVPVVENVSDPDRSIYQKNAADGLKMPRRIAIRQDVKPTHELFRDNFFGYLLCTERLALRVLQRRCSGVRFFDPEYLDNPMRFRSLRGIEEETWDPVQEKYHTKLVQSIP